MAAFAWAFSCLVLQRHWVWSSDLCSVIASVLARTRSRSIIFAALDRTYALGFRISFEDLGSVRAAPDLMTMSSFDNQILDTILALQLSVGWAGEKAEDPQRLSWWNTDLTDTMAGGDLFARLLPKTFVWAGLELARQAALRADRAARSKLAHPDQVWTLFHFGFELDEAIQDRLEHHKRHAGNPTVAFAEVWGVEDCWNQASLEAFLGNLGKPQVEET